MGTGSLALTLKDNKTSRNLFWYIALLYAVVFMTKNCFGTALAGIVAEGIMTKSQTGLITSAFYIVYAPLQIVGGMLSDKVRPDRLIKLGLFGGILSNAVIFVNHNYYVMLTAWVINGIMQSALYPALFKIITSQLSPAWRKKGLFYFSFSSASGLIFGYVIAAFVTKWQYNFLVSAVCSLLLYVTFSAVYKKAYGKMVPEEAEEKEEKTAAPVSVKTVSLFLLSGFFFILPVNFFRYMVDNSLKNLTPVMLMESYPNLNVTISNLLNVIILVSGLFGILLVRKFLYPKHMKNEVGCILFLSVLMLPCAFIIKFTGVINVWFVLIAMCILAMCLSGAVLMNSFYTGCFAAYGKNGTAAGVGNAATSLSIVLQSYGFAFIADKFGWGAVTTAYIVCIVLCILFTSCALPFWTKFRKEEK
ncbi:MAG: MFS transporter [Clostridia bacterium]|nr:MFS transporter [Clostridia bacterium]